MARYMDNYNVLMSIARHLGIQPSKHWPGILACTWSRKHWPAILVNKKPRTFCFEALHILFWNTISIFYLRYDYCIALFVSLEQATSDELPLLRAIVDNVNINTSVPDERYAIAPWTDPEEHSGNSSREKNNKFSPDELDTLFEDYVNVCVTEKKYSLRRSSSMSSSHSSSAGGQPHVLNAFPDWSRPRCNIWAHPCQLWLFRLNVFRPNLLSRSSL